ncbi:MAG: HAD family hydrolase [Bacteroidetes bacterium HGW-Bacteroidetes-1]|jgi:HAD superfamily hydrolase (TIGR01509 family)|nr:MAG: HAD family hydrolase [Bacteroidetes bacterium HGW-Bacteroidetes-1]
MLKALVFDWGNTIMRDFNLPGPMSEWEKVAWVPGAKAALEDLSKRYCCIIATSANHSDTNEMKLALDRVGAVQYFHQFYSQKELGFKKPDIRFFEEVIKNSGFAANEIAMIGDLYEKDIIGAKAAGLTTVLLNESGIKGPFPLADYEINEMNLLLTLF